MTKGETVINFSLPGLLKIIIVGVLFYFLIELRELILVILTAIVIASFVESTNQFMFRRFRMNRSLSIGIIYALLFLVLAGAFYLFVPVLIKETSMLVSALSSYFPDFINNSTNILQNISNGSSLVQFVSSTQSFVSKLSGGFLNTIISIFGGIINFILIIVISFYLSVQERGVEKFLKIITPLKHEAYVIGLWDRTQKKITLWIRGQMILGLIVGLITYGALAIAGVKYALIFAILTAFMELIPYGVLLSAVPAIAVAFSDGGVTKGLIVTVIFFVIQQAEGYFLQPIVLKKSVGISPIVVIISVLAGAKLAGFWGIILAIPVATAVLEYLSDVEENKINPRQVSG